MNYEYIIEMDWAVADLIDEFVADGKCGMGMKNAGKF